MTSAFIKGYFMQYLSGICPSSCYSEDLTKAILYHIIQGSTDKDAQQKVLSDLQHQE